MVLVILSMGWNSYKKYQTRKSQLALYRLRDELRELAIIGTVSKNQWMFDYLDSSISKSINNLQSINIWAVIILGQIHKKDESLGSFKYHLGLAIKKNKELAEIHKRYSNIMTQYVSENT